MIRIPTNRSPAHPGEIPLTEFLTPLILPFGNHLFALLLVALLTPITH